MRRAGRTALAKRRPPLRSTAKWRALMNPPSQPKYATPEPGDTLVSANWAGYGPPSDWSAIQIRPQSVEPVAALDGCEAAVREAIEAARACRIGWGNLDGNGYLTAYAAIDPVTRRGYVEVWDNEFLSSTALTAVITVRRALREVLEAEHARLCELGGMTEVELSFKFDIPIEMPPRRKNAKARRGRPARADVPKLTAQLKRLLSSLNGLDDPSRDEAPVRRAMTLAAKLTAARSPLRLITETRNLQGAGFTVTADVERRLVASDQVLFEWQFQLAGESAQYLTGLLLTGDSDPPVSYCVLRYLGLEPDEYSGFPSDWSEVLDVLGDE